MQHSCKASTVSLSRVLQHGATRGEDGSSYRQVAIWNEANGLTYKAMSLLLQGLLYACPCWGDLWDICASDRHAQADVTA